MNNEIKKILEELESLFEISEAPEHITNGFNKTKDYITNLQKENKKLLKKSYSDDVIITEAIKMVKQNLMGIGYVEVYKLLNILQGSE